MSRKTRVLQKVFAQNAGFDQLAKFGSLAAGAPEFITNIADVQDLSNWVDGWFASVLGNNSPAIEDMNSMHWLFAYQLAYLMENGIPEWNTDTTYYTGQFSVSSTGTIYVSRTDSNLGNALTDLTNWKVYGGPMTTIGDMIYAGANGSALRLAPGSNGNMLRYSTATNSPAWAVEPTLQKQIFSSGGVFTIPVGTLSTTVFKFVVKGGGGGGGGGDASHSGGGAGGEGGTTIKWLSGFTAGNTLTITIGGGGPGAGGGPNNGTSGSDSAVTSGTQTISTITGSGGIFGSGSSNNTANPGGQGGNGSGGDVNIQGQSGGFGFLVSAGNGFGGIGGGQGGSRGGYNAIGAESGISASAPGAGGGGGGSTSGVTSGFGGNGSGGEVIIEWVL